MKLNDYKDEEKANSDKRNDSKERCMRKQAHWNCKLCSWEST